MHHVFRIRQTVRKPHFSKRLMLTEEQFLDATKTGPYSRPNLASPSYKSAIGNVCWQRDRHLLGIERLDPDGTSDLRRMPVMCVCQTSGPSSGRTHQFETYLVGLHRS